MKPCELNPKTGEPFKFGDVREDGYIFRQWGRIKPNGTRQPLWMSPEAFAKNREQSKKYQKEKAKELREWVNALKVFYGCSVCGYNKEAEGLDIDHLHSKSFNVGGEIKTNKKRIINEIKKCQILCGTCHNIKTRAPEKYAALIKLKGGEKCVDINLFLNYEGRA
jgi:5-methylcytosine-specific restriction endonuclease McrA